MQNESVTNWLAQLKAGEMAGVQPLWERFFTRLVGLARSRMSMRRGAADEEDVALSAFDSFCRGATAGRFPKLDDRDDVWRVLVVIATRKIHDYARHELRLKRGGPVLPAVEVDWNAILASDPTPDFAAEVAEQFERLLARLGNDDLRAIAVQKMEGYTTVEIAKQRECTLRTVERKLRLIRETWAREE